uniref:Uncharacterized protein n=1 Tax=Romanomermis culicivorax TaxID=13658 RepID=A0A915L0Z5_ROMCU
MKRDDDTPKSECSVILTQNQRTIPLTPTTDWKRSSLHLTTLGKINDDKPYPSSSSPTYCSIKKGPASKEHPTTDFPPPPPPEVGVGSKFTMLKRNLVEDLKDSSSVSSSSSSKHSSESVLTKSGHVKIRSWNFEDIQPTTPREIDDWRHCFAVAEDTTLTFHFSYKYSKKSDKDSASSPNPNERHCKNDVL